MEKLHTKKQPAHVLWVSQSKHIISFHQVEDDSYERLLFQSQKTKMEFALEKCSDGFRIQ